MNRLIVTFFYTGLLPKAPGTWGSAATIPLAWLLHWAGGFPLVLVATLVLLGVGIWAVRGYLAGSQDDPKEVVIDEVVGMMIALWPLSWGLDRAGVDPWIFPWPGWVGGFLMFRLFDIWKPGPIRWLDRPGPVGVMADDVAAGVVAAAIVFASAWISHGGI